MLMPRRLPPPQEAGFKPGELSDLLSPHGMGLSSDVRPDTISRVAQVRAGGGLQRW